ncbi:MAG: CpsD/CapB family tyrosine-protein kinase [Hydrogenophaga sp.]|uniref:CpsD/CapB family tyrosine-protein kinase n=1 Tax=Hydrogenophaga sp. TaxID=1904254 RepID=UPI003D0F3121
MERIKQALEKAKAEGEIVRGRAPAPMEKANAASTASGAAAPETAIRYSQTRVHTVDPHVLKENRVIYGDADRVGLTAYKMLRTQVMQRMASRQWNALAITSPAPGDGKTLTAVNLAISLARELHHTVLLVDMDLRNPSVHKCFGLRPEKGIGDCLQQQATLGDALVNPGIERLVLLPGRNAVENSSEILASPAVGALVQELKTRYPSRMVLFDLPPVLSADDALAFAPFVDAFLLVIQDGKTTRTELDHTMEILKDATILGTVLNASDEKISTYY